MQQPFRKGKKRMKISSKPCYSLKEMKRLVENGDYSPTLRVADFIDRHYGENWIDEVVEKVFSSLREDDFVKSFELKNLPGTMADVYVGGCYDDTEWYVKAFIDKGGVELQIWSMCWDGAVY